MLDEKRTYKIYGIKPHELSIEEIDELRQQVYFDGYAIATSWIFNTEPMEQFINAILADKIFALRWEDYKKKDEEKSSGMVLEPILDKNSCKVIDDEVVESMNDFIHAGIPSGLSAFITLLNMGQENPLTLEDTTWIQESEAVIQMDPKTYESTLEIVSLLKKQWNQRALEDILKNFGQTLKQQQKIFNILYNLPSDTVANISYLNSSTIHFLTHFVSDLICNDQEISLLVELINKINTEDSYKLDKIQNAWRKIINHNFLLSKSVSEMTMDEKTTKEEIVKSFELFKIKELSFNDYTTLRDLWCSVQDTTVNSYSDKEKLYILVDLIFAATIFVYGGEHVIKTVKKHQSYSYTFFHYLTLMEYEKDGSNADPNLLFSVFGINDC